MSKVLVIKGANFSTNKVATIEFDVEVPCTGISLNHETLSLYYEGTGSLAATPTPSDTTDSISWATSNSNVVTVDGGVLSAVGIGTATITATCGSFSASCEITVTASELTGTQIVGARIAGSGVADGGNGLGTISSALQFGTIASENGTYHTYISASTLEGTYYPNIIPRNTKKLKITIGGNVNDLRLGLYNSNTQIGSSYPDVAKMIKFYDTGSLTFTNNVCEFEIPTLSGQPQIDSFIISYRSISAFTSSDFNNCSVEYLAETGS